MVSSSRRQQAWGSREGKGWWRDLLSHQEMRQIPARGRRGTWPCSWSWAAPGAGQEKVHRPGLPLLPRLQPKPQAGPPAPGGRRHSFPSRGTGGPAAPRPAGRENLPPLLRPPEEVRKTGAPCKLRRSSQSQERAVTFRARAPAKAPHPGRDRLLVAGRKVRLETVQSGSTGGESQSELSSEEEEKINERIIEWLIGVNECLYREPRLRHWTSLSQLEQGTSIKIVHEGD